MGEINCGPINRARSHGPTRPSARAEGPRRITRGPEARARIRPIDQFALSRTSHQLINLHPQVINLHPQLINLHPTDQFAPSSDRFAPLTDQFAPSTAQLRLLLWDLVGEGRRPEPVSEFASEASPQKIQKHLEAGWYARQRWG